jgi:mRNA interferase HigB
MRIIKRSTLQEFWEKHPDSKNQLGQWYHITSKSKWKNLNEVKETFPNVSILSNNRIVFNIKGNDYRIVVVIKFYTSTVYICWVGKHSDYDNIDANAVWQF